MPPRPRRCDCGCVCGECENTCDCECECHEFDIIGTQDIKAILVQKHDWNGKKIAAYNRNMLFAEILDSGCVQDICETLREILTNTCRRLQKRKIDTLYRSPYAEAESTRRTPPLKKRIKPKKATTCADS